MPMIYFSFLVPYLRIRVKTAAQFPTIQKMQRTIATVRSAMRSLSGNNLRYSSSSPIRLKSFVSFCVKKVRKFTDFVLCWVTLRATKWCSVLNVSHPAHFFRFPGILISAVKYRWQGISSTISFS
jgi:hypothetical protein